MFGVLIIIKKTQKEYDCFLCFFSIGPSATFDFKNRSKLRINIVFITKK